MESIVWGKYILMWVYKYLLNFFCELGIGYIKISLI